MDTAKDRFSFLGREFLTWLWFEAERNGGKVAAGELGEIGVTFGQRLSLETGGGVREGSTVQSDAPAEAEEARTALRTGKKVARARLFLEVGERQYQVGLDAETLTFGNAKLPVLLGKGEANALDERLALLDELEAVMDALFVGFVRLRKDDAGWAPVRDEMRQWVAQGLKIA